MSKKPFIVQDPAMRALADRISQLIDQVDALIQQPDRAAERRFLADVNAMKRDLNAELIARNPPIGWDVLEQKTSQMIQ
jgi:nitrate/nitrite-specific signal transduction histidine kinase